MIQKEALYTGQDVAASNSGYPKDGTVQKKGPSSEGFLGWRWIALCITKYSPVIGRPAYRLSDRVKVINSMKARPTLR